MWRRWRKTRLHPGAAPTLSRWPPALEGAGRWPTTWPCGRWTMRALRAAPCAAVHRRNRPGRTAMPAPCAWRGGAQAARPATFTEVPGVRWYRVQVAAGAQFLPSPCATNSALTECTACPWGRARAAASGASPAAAWRCPAERADQGHLRRHSPSLAVRPAALSLQALQAKGRRTAKLRLHWPRPGYLSLPAAARRPPAWTLPRLPRTPCSTPRPGRPAAWLPALPGAQARCWTPVGWATSPTAQDPRGHRHPRVRACRCPPAAPWWP